MKIIEGILVYYLVKKADMRHKIVEKLKKPISIKKFQEGIAKFESYGGKCIIFR